MMKWDAEKYDTVVAPQAEAGEELIDMADIHRADFVLDVGCGTGKLTARIAGFAHDGTVIGLDPSAEMLGRAKRLCQLRKNMVFIQMPAQAMDFDDQFDLIFSNSALHWIKEQEQVLGLVYNALRKGGRLAFQLPAENFCPEFFEYAEGALRELSLERFFAGWERPWFLPDRDTYRALLRSAGFKRLDVFYRDYDLQFSSVGEIIGWWSSAGLRPYLERLPERERDYFQYAMAMSFEKNRTPNGLGFNFKRLFAFGKK